MYVYDLESFQFLQVNDAAVAFYGFSQEEFSRLTLLDIRAEEAASAPDRDDYNGSEPQWFSGEWRHCKKDGSVVDVQIVRHLIHFGGCDAGLGVVQDITARKRSDREIVSRAHQQSALAELSQRAFEGLDLAKLFDEAARTVARTLSVDFADVLEWMPSEKHLVFRAGVSPAESLPPASLRDGKDSQAGYTLLCGAPVVVEDLRLETRFQAPLLAERNVISGVSVAIPGAEHPFGVLTAHSRLRRSFFPHEVQFLQAIAHFLATAMQKMRAEEALQHSETRYRELVENATYGIYRASIGGEFLQVNPALVRILGYASKQELIEQPANSIYRNPQDAGLLLEEYCRTGRVDGVQVEWNRKDGSFTTVRLSGRAVLGDAGNPEGLEIIVEDVAERSALENQLRQAQKFEAIGQLAGGIAHDFNNVIGAIMGWAELGAEQAPGQTRVQTYFVKIGEQAARAAGLTRQLLAFARRQILEPQNIDVNNIVADVLSLLEKVIGKHIEIETRLKPGLATVRADPTQLEQVLLNLCVNARDAMPQGGRLSIETGNIDISSDVSRFFPGLAPGSYAELVVTDTGTGMDAATRDRIFEPFFTTKEPGKGTGLGLATVFGIIKQHNGHIQVQSELGRGTTFRLFLPAVRTGVPPAAPATTSHTEAFRGGSETLLLAEDHEGLREIARVALERRGYHVLVAADGEEAARIFREHPAEIALAILDIVMPRLGGLAAAAVLRGIHPGLPVVFTTGFSADVDALADAVEKGEVVLNKPYEPAILAAKIRELLDRTAGQSAVFAQESASRRRPQGA
jgi:two-component system, cell cycle sensor histidine kinase and response regulator CckA